MTPAIDEAVARILGGASGPEIGAFFDFDGTLIDGYSAAAYLSDRLRHGEMGLREIVDTLRLARQGELSEAQFGDVIGKAVLDWAGLPEDDIRQLWDDLFRKKISDTQFPEAWQLVQAHRKMGHTVAIASSATPYQVMPLAAEWGVQHLLCTQPMVRNGRLTGGIIGKPAWGEGKAQAVTDFAQLHGVRLQDSFGYANGNEDIPFLGCVGHPTAVNPKERLAGVAAENAWATLRFAARRRSSAASVARTVGAYGAMGLSFAAGLAYARATRKTRRAVDMITSVGSEWGLAVAGIEVEVHGEENLWMQRPAVFILNHQSKLDFFVMMYITRRGFTGVAKKEAANTPGFGRFMRMADMAFIDRSDGRKAREVLAPVVDKIKSGLCLCIAPEGTRSYSPRIGKFKKGAFHIAIQAGVPVVPVVIRNAAELMPRNGQTFRAGTVQVAVLPPVAVKDWKRSDLEKNVELVRQQFIDTLDHWPGKAA